MSWRSCAATIDVLNLPLPTLVSTSSQKSKTIRAPRAAAVEFRDLVSYRLQKAAFYATRPSYQVYAREFGITGIEWRLMGNLYTDGPLSLARVAAEADVQLAQASRTLSSLTRRGLVHSEADVHDGRSVRLSLTVEGRALYRRLLARAVKMHESLVASLTADERDSLFRVLDKLSEVGRELLAAERGRRR